MIAVTMLWAFIQMPPGNSDQRKTVSQRIRSHRSHCRKKQINSQVIGFPGRIGQAQEAQLGHVNGRVLGVIAG